MKKSKKVQKNLESRTEGYHDALAIMAKEERNSKEYRMPGSRSERK